MLGTAIATACAPGRRAAQRIARPLCFAGFTLPLTLRRDLKPENLLLSDGSESAVLKVRQGQTRACEESACDLSTRCAQIADFGLSAAFAIAAGSDDDEKASALSPHSPRVRRLKSVVGSPHYVAPEVTTESIQGEPLAAMFLIAHRNHRNDRPQILHRRLRWCEG